MCNINDYIQNTAQYIETALNSDINITPIPQKDINKLPLMVTSNYKFFWGNWFDTKVCLLYYLDSSECTPNQLYKQMLLIKNKLSMPVIYIFEKVASYNIQRLIAQRVNFIIPGKQLFIPELLIDLKKQKNIIDQTEIQIPPIAQCILLYHLEKSSLDNLTAKDLSQLFQVSYASINRAVRWLTNNNIISLTVTKEKKQIFPLNGKDLWNKIESHLTSPVERKVYTDKFIDSVCVSGINALSAYSMLNEEPHKCYAISKEDFKELTIQTNKEYGDNCIEIWRYNPQILAENGIVDKLSLYLSLKDIKDERVQIELENMINEVKW